MPATAMLHEVDPRQALLEKIGPVNSNELFHNQVLVAVYQAPEKTAGGIIRPETNRDEDKHQGKVGLIIAMGPKAFKSDSKWEWPDDMAVGDWIYFRASDGWATTINSKRDNFCRILEDVDVKGRIQHPDEVW